MKRYLVLMLLAVAFLLNCTSKNSAANGPLLPSEDSLAKQQFFPLTVYLKGQIYSIKEKTINPLVKTIVNEKVVDSAWLPFEQFENTFEPFTTPEIDSLSLIKEYAQNTFEDKSIGAITFTHQRIKPIIDTNVYTLKSWDFYIDTKTNAIRRVFMVKQKGKSQLQLTWENDKQCMQRFITEKEDGSLVLEKEIIINWDF